MRPARVFERCTRPKILALVVRQQSSVLLVRAAASVQVLIHNQKLHHHDTGYVPPRVNPELRVEKARPAQADSFQAKETVQMAPSPP